MLNQFLYDFRRTLKSKTVIIITVVLLLFSLTILPLLSINLSGLPNVNASFAIYKKEDSTNALIYVYDMFGNPLSKAHVIFSFYNESPANLILKLDGDTNSSGYVLFNGLKFEFNRTIYYNLTIEYAGIKIIQPGAFLNVKLPSLFNIITVVGDPSDPNKRRIMVFFVEEDGSKPIGYSVYYSFNRTMKFLGNINDYVSFFSIDTSNITSNSMIDIYIKKDSSIRASHSIPGIMLAPPLANVDALTIASQFIASIIGLLAPLLVLMASYNLYGKDKIGGILDFILSLPITRNTLALSRFLSILSASFISVIITLVFADLLVYNKLGTHLQISYVALEILGLFIALSSFIAISFLLSLFLRSTSSLLISLIMIWVVFGLFWNTIVVLLSFALGYQIGSLNFYKLDVLMSYFNPIQYSRLLAMYFTNSYLSGFGRIAIDVSQLGVNITLITITGALWIIIPLYLFFYYLNKRD